MRIVEVKAYPLAEGAHPGEKPWMYTPYWRSLFKARAWGQRGISMCLVEVVTDEGLRGYGESIVREVPGATALIVNELLRPILLGCDPFDVEVLWQRMYHTLRTRGHHKGFLVEALSGVDCALWDILGKAVGKPVYKLIGGLERDRVKAYASSIPYGKPEEVSSTALRLVEEGHDQLKLKVGMGPAGLGWRSDERNIKALREALGYDVDLIVDANSAFTYRQALRLGRTLERYEVLFFEEPVPPDNLEGYVRLTESLDVPICGGESHYLKYDFRDLISRHAVDMINPDLARIGGLTEARKIAAIAEAYEVEITPHIGLSGVGCRAATLQLCASLPERLFLAYEYMYKGVENPLIKGILKEELEKFDKGYVKVPDKPGLGLALDMEAVQRHLINQPT
ncbi:mandelate racemase/muconate lactonizing enzyme family protein [Candidatus Bathyarchaeota archaeon]|nr:mandelate racemase/muconate lactonizing enzyme family protein [Candidatus Bathyarchaeota archaeon]